MLPAADTPPAEVLLCPARRTLATIPTNAFRSEYLATQQAVANAQKRWPDLAGMLPAAVVLVEEHAVCVFPYEAQGLAMCQPTSVSPGHLVSQTPTGLGCSCDAWPPTKRAGPGDGLYCPDILAVLLHVYLRRPVRPLPCSPETLWQEALAELQHQMTRATFTSWLAGTRAVPEARSAQLLTIEVRSRYAQEWLTHRLQPVIARTLAGIVGYCVEVQFVVTPMRNERPG
jgi:hypothetical protein